MIIELPETYQVVLKKVDAITHYAYIYVPKRFRSTMLALLDQQQWIENSFENNEGGICSQLSTGHDLTNAKDALEKLCAHVMEKRI